MTLIEGLDDATPPLRVNRQRWLGRRCAGAVEAATAPERAATATRIPSTPWSAPTSALYWYHRPEDVTIYGDFATGYIVTPTLPPVPIPVDEHG